jgi:hypothetical protein
MRVKALFLGGRETVFITDPIASTNLKFLHQAFLGKLHFAPVFGPSPFSLSLSYLD